MCPSQRPTRLECLQILNILHFSTISILFQMEPIDQGKSGEQLAITEALDKQAIIPPATSLVLYAELGSPILSQSPEAVGLSTPLLNRSIKLTGHGLPNGYQESSLSEVDQIVSDAIEEDSTVMAEVHISPASIENPPEVIHMGANDFAAEEVTMVESSILDRASDMFAHLTLLAPTGSQLPKDELFPATVSTQALTPEGGLLHSADRPNWALAPNLPRHTSERPNWALAPDVATPVEQNAALSASEKTVGIDRATFSDYPFASRSRRRERTPKTVSEVREYPLGRRDLFTQAIQSLPEASRLPRRQMNAILPSFSPTWLDNPTRRTRSRKAHGQTLRADFLPQKGLAFLLDETSTSWNASPLTESPVPIRGHVGSIFSGESNAFSQAIISPFNSISAFSQKTLQLGVVGRSSGQDTFMSTFHSPGSSVSTNSWPSGEHQHEGVLRNSAEILAPPVLGQDRGSTAGPLRSGIITPSPNQLCGGFENVFSAQGFGTPFSRPNFNDPSSPNHHGVEPSRDCYHQQPGNPARAHILAAFKARQRKLRHPTPIIKLAKLFQHDPGKIEKIGMKKRAPDHIPTFNTQIQTTRRNSIAHEQEDDAPLKIYTDGSGIDKKTGAAALLYTGKSSNPTKTLRYHLGSITEHSTYEAEWVGAIMALWILHTTAKQEVGQIPISVYTDNQGVIMALRAGKPGPGQYLQDEFIRLADALRNRGENKIKFTLKWISAHSQVARNERVDEEAKKAAQGDVTFRMDLPPLLRKKLPRSKSAVKQEIKKRADEAWASSWEASPRKAKYDLLDQEFPFTTYRKISQNLPRTHATVLTQIRTGHVPLNGFLNKIGLSPTDTCQKCKMNKRETIDHFLFECPAYRKLRSKMDKSHGQSKHILKEILSDEAKTAALIQYVIRTKRFKTQGQPYEQNQNHDER